MTANDDNISPGDATAATRVDRSPRTRLGAMRDWLGGHGPQTLGGALLVAIAGGAVSGLFGLFDGGGDTQASPGGPSSPAAITPSCFQATCKGGDAEEAGCHDAQTLADDWQSTMHVMVRYSARCSVVWGKLTGAEVGDTIEIATSPTTLQRASVQTGHTKYTKMLPVGKEFSAQATGVSVNGDPESDIPAGFRLPVGADQNDVRHAPEATAR